MRTPGGAVARPACCSRGGRGVPPGMAWPGLHRSARGPCSPAERRPLQRRLPASAAPAAGGGSAAPRHSAARWPRLCDAHAHEHARPGLAQTLGSFLSNSLSANGRLCVQAFSLRCEFISISDLFDFSGPQTRQLQTALSHPCCQPHYTGLLENTQLQGSRVFLPSAFKLF